MSRPFNRPVLGRRWYRDVRYIVRGSRDGLEFEAELIDVGTNELLGFIYAPTTIELHVACEARIDRIWDTDP